MATLRRGGMPRVGILMAAGVLLAGCTGGGDEPAPTGSGSTTTDASASPATPGWSATPVWRGTVWFRQSADMPVTMRLYPLQRIDGRVLLTVDFTPQGTEGQRMDVLGPFCFGVSCLTMESVNLIDPVAMARYGPLLQGEEGSPRHDEFAASKEKRSAKLAGVTYRYGAFFADPGSDSVAVTLAHAGAIPSVPIVDGGPTAPGLVGPGPDSRTATPSPLPSVETEPDDAPLVTLPVPMPPSDAGANSHVLVAPIVGGDVTDYTGTVNLNADVLFAFDSAKLSAEAKTLLAQAVRTIQEKADPATPLQVTGHTDNVGGTTYNRRLSTDRANAVAAYLKADATTRSWKLEIAGKGESDPVVPNTTADGKDDPTGRALNRRVEITYTPKPEPTPSPTPPSSSAAPQSTIADPTPAATLGPIELSSSTTAGGPATAEIDPVVVQGGLALVRFDISPQGEYLINDAFSTLKASRDPGAIRLTDDATKSAYLAAYDEGDERSIVGTDSGHTAKVGRTYSYFVYTAAPPADLDEITVDLGPFGEFSVPIER